MDFKKSKSGAKESGRKGRLDEHTLGYYRRVSETIKDGFDAEEEKDIFLQNIFKQLSEELVQVSQNQTASAILEELLQMASHEHLLLLVKPVSQNLEVMSCDKFASHVLQSMMVKIGHFIHRPGNCSEDVDVLRQCLFDLWRFLKSNLGLYMQDTYASHVLRALIEVMGGVKVTDSVIRSRLSNQFKKGVKKTEEKIEESTEPSSEQLEELKTIYKDIVGFTKLTDYLQNTMSNPVIQTVVLVLHKRLPKSCDKMCKKLLKLCFDKTEDESLSGLVTDTCGSHLVEQIVAIASPELFEYIFNTYIRGRISLLAFHPVANFVLQKCMSVCHTKEQFEVLYQEVSGIIEELMARNHLGVVVQLAEGTVRHNTKQDKLLKCFMKTFHCYKPEERQSKLVPLVASLTTYEVFYKVKDKSSSDDDSHSDSDDSDNEEEVHMPLLKTVNYHGSLLLQKLLQFGNVKTLVSSLLELKVVELVILSCDPCGSHVIDAFVKSENVSDKNREKVINKLKDGYATLACNKNGSRTLDVVWSKATVKQKSVIAEELSKHANKIRSDRFGHHIWRNFGLHLFTTKKEQWVNFQTGRVKKRKMFDDIVSPQGNKKMQRNDALPTDEERKWHKDQSFVESTERDQDSTKGKKNNSQSYKKKWGKPNRSIKQGEAKKPKRTAKKHLLKGSGARKG